MTQDNHNEYCAGDINRVIRHERELEGLSILTKTLTEQNEKIVDSLNLFTDTIGDLKVVISQQNRHAEELTELKNEIRTFREEISTLTDKVDRRESAEFKLIKKNIKYLTWINSGIEKVIEKAGYYLPISIILLIAYHFDILQKAFHLFK